MHCNYRWLRTISMIMLAGAVSACSSRTSAPPPAAISRIINLDGFPTDPLSNTDRRATVLLFITNDCPISNGYAPEIHRLCDAYMNQGIGFCLVYADRDLTPAAAREHYRDYGYQCMAVLDPDHQLVARAGATVTPEAAVFLPDGKLTYRGRIDDLYLDYGKARFAATTHDLKDVLESIAQGRPIAARTTPAVGCHIPM